MKQFIGIIFLLGTLSGCKDSNNSKEQKKNEFADEKLSSQEKSPEPKETESVKNTLSKEDAVKLAEQQFNAYLPKILESYDAGIDIQHPAVGDFTGDGIDDVAIYWSLAPSDGGNAIVGQGISLYKNDGHKIKVIAGYEPDYLFAFDTISNGKIIVEKLEYAEGDGRCCPSIKTRHALTISGNKAY